MKIENIVHLIKTYNDYHFLCNVLSLEELQFLVAEYERLKEKLKKEQSDRYNLGQGL